MSDLLTLHDVRSLLKCARSTLYKYIATCAFPRPIKLGGGVNRWRRDEVEAWLAAQPRANIHVEPHDGS